MTKKAVQIDVNEEVIEERANNMVENAQKAAQTVVRAGLGAADMARDEVMNLLEKTQQDVADILEKFIARGEKIEEKGRQQIEERVEVRRAQVKDTVSDTSNAFEKRVESVLHTMNVPTKKDIDALSKKISTLTRKVNELSKEAKSN